MCWSLKDPVLSAVFTPTQCLAAQVKASKDSFIVGLFGEDSLMSDYLSTSWYIEQIEKEMSREYIKKQIRNVPARHDMINALSQKSREKSLYVYMS